MLPQVPAIPGEAALAACAARLGAMRLLLVEPGRGRRFQRVALNLPLDDLVHFLKNDEEMPWLKNLV